MYFHPEHEETFDSKLFIRAMPSSSPLFSKWTRAAKRSDLPSVHAASRLHYWGQIHQSEILMNANWQMMAMLNVLIAAAGACLMYYTEYADNAVQRMCMLPIKESRLFFDKAALITVSSADIKAEPARFEEHLPRMPTPHKLSLSYTAVLFFSHRLP